MSKAIAVVLTYNRKDLLKKCLDAIYSQTRPCDEVIVIDNASSDGTEQMLAESSLPRLKVQVLSENIGASGGFNAGFRIAYKAGADLVWMMDDDVIAQPDALEKLMDADLLLQEQGIERAFLLSTALTENGLITNSPSLDTRQNRIRYEQWPLTLEHGIAPVRRATFVSILVPRATIEQYGLPIASMFIWGEDTEYTLRITDNTPGFIVGSSKVLHLRQESGAINITTEKSPTRIRYHRHYVRNEVFIARKYYRQRRWIMTVLHQFSVIAELAMRKEFKKCCVVFRGLVESSSFFPGVEAADAPIENLGVSVRTVYPAGRDNLSHFPSPVFARQDQVTTDLDEHFLEQGVRALCN